MLFLDPFLLMVIFINIQINPFLFPRDAGSPLTENGFMEAEYYAEVIEHPNHYLENITLNLLVFVIFLRIATMVNHHH